MTDIGKMSTVDPEKIKTDLVQWLLDKTKHLDEEERKEAFSVIVEYLRRTYDL